MTRLEKPRTDPIYVFRFSRMKFIAGISLFFSFLVIAILANNKYCHKESPIVSEKYVFSRTKVTDAEGRDSLWIKDDTENLYFANSSLSKFKYICSESGCNVTEFVDDNKYSLENPHFDINGTKIKRFSKPEFISEKLSLLMLEKNHYFWGFFQSGESRVMRHVYFFPREENDEYGYIVIAIAK